MKKLGFSHQIIILLISNLLGGCKWTIYNVTTSCDIVNFVFLLSILRCLKNRTEYCKQMFSRLWFLLIWYFFTLENFSRIKKCHHYRWRAANLDLCSPLIVILRSEGSLAYHTYWDMGPQIEWSYPMTYHTHSCV